MTGGARVPLHAGGANELLKALHAALIAARRRLEDLRRAPVEAKDLEQAEEELHRLEEETRHAEQNIDSFLF